MNPISDVVLKYLASVKVDTVDVRTARALLTAQVLSFAIPIGPGSTEQDIEARYGKLLLEVLGEVNEKKFIDVRLARALFFQTLKSRIALISLPSDLSLIKLALSGTTAGNNLTTNEHSIIDQVAQSSEFINYTRDAVVELNSLGGFEVDLDSAEG